jgi:hypothetical protein
MAMKNHLERDSTTYSCFDLTTAIPQSQPFARLQVFQTPFTV